MKKRFLLASLACLTGCTVGPNYGGPPSVVASAPAFHRSATWARRPPQAPSWPNGGPR